MAWGVILLEEVHSWFLELDHTSATAVAVAIDMLEQAGPTLGRPLADRIAGSRYHQMKELRPPSSGATELRILFAFDPARNAILLVAGDKSGEWRGWYEKNIEIADDRFTEWLDGDRDEEM